MQPFRFRLSIQGRQPVELGWIYWRMAIKFERGGNAVSAESSFANGMTVTPLAGPFGAAINGVDLSQPVSQDAFKRIATALRDHHILVIEEQKLDKPQYLAFGQRWGTPITFFNPSHREVEYPNLIVIHNREDTPQEFRNGALHWHVDSSYEDPPASVTMLYAAEAPAVGNETLFLDMAAAYDALPAAMKIRIDDLIVEHGIGDARLYLEGEYRGGVMKGDAPVQTRPTFRHPLVIRHPQTGAKVLYAPAGSAFGIVGMDTDDAIALLRELKMHATQERFMQRAAARAGSVLVWDNYAVMHSATPTRYSDRDGERRLLYRISTRDVVSL